MSGSTSETIVTQYLVVILMTKLKLHKCITATSRNLSIVTKLISHNSEHCLQIKKILKKKSMLFTFSNIRHKSAGSH